jgi:hypothetical protein
MDEVKDICFMIGCSGEGKKCPGDPSCSILQKIIKEPHEDKRRTKTISDRYQRR